MLWLKGTPPPTSQTSLTWKAKHHHMHIPSHLPACHAVEEVLLGSDASQEAAGDKAAGPQREVIGCEGGQGPATAHQWGPTTLQLDLSQQAGDLLAVGLHTHTHTHTHVSQVIFIFQVLGQVNQVIFVLRDKSGHLHLSSPRTSQPGHLRPSSPRDKSGHLHLSSPRTSQPGHLRPSSPRDKSGHLHLSSPRDKSARSSSSSKSSHKTFLFSS